MKWINGRPLGILSFQQLRRPSVRPSIIKKSEWPFAGPCAVLCCAASTLHSTRYVKLLAVICRTEERNRRPACPISDRFVNHIVRLDTRSVGRLKQINTSTRRCCRRRRRRRRRVDLLKGGIFSQFLFFHKKNAAAN